MSEHARGVVIWDTDTDRLVELHGLVVSHEGRERVLDLRVARGTIRDLMPRVAKGQAPA